MTRIALLVTTLVGTLLYALPAQAQRVFVAATGSDSNPCTFTSPCRSFQHAHDVASSGGEIDVLDPAGYGAVTITKTISIQAHGFGGITQMTSGANAITISAGTSGAVTLNGLLIDGAGTGNDGIHINSVGSVQILNCVVRNFADVGIYFAPSGSGAELLVEDTVVSDTGLANGTDGIFIFQNATSPAILNRVTANGNFTGVYANAAPVMITNSVMSRNSNGVAVEGTNVWLATSTISSNGQGVDIISGTVTSYGNNSINGNLSQDVHGTLTKITPE